MRYNSIHAYLDAVFADIANPSDTAIAKAKADYWKLYRHNYQKDRRANIKEFTLGFDGEALLKIDNKRQELSVSEFLYQCVYRALKTSKSVMDNKLLGVIQQQQLQIIMQLETLLEGEDTLVTETILERMEVLEMNIQNLRS